ncbi:MAG: uracil-DNA glycosylase [Pseudomonadota bacterium]
MPDPDRSALIAALAWQVELGADEAMLDAPVDRFAASAPRAAAPPVDGEAAPPQRPGGAAAEPAPPARAQAASAPAPRAAPRTASAAASATAPGPALGAAPDEPPSLDAIRAAPDLERLATLGRALEAPSLKPGARSFVFADGRPGARLMIVGEAPGADEDRLGRPFVGRAGQLLDRMLAAIGLARDAPDPGTAVYITNVLPWRPPGNRRPEAAEIATFLPVLERHIALAAPEVLMVLGNTPLRALAGESGGITRARGTWRTHGPTGIAYVPSFHPAYLLRTPSAKREAWADWLTVAAHLDLPIPTPGAWAP